MERGKRPLGKIEERKYSTFSHIAKIVFQNLFFSLLYELKFHRRHRHPPPPKKKKTYLSGTGAYEVSI
jgi:hypothetical protein